MKLQTPFPDPEVAALRSERDQLRARVADLEESVIRAAEHCAMNDEEPILEYDISKFDKVRKCIRMALRCLEETEPTAKLSKRRTITNFNEEAERENQLSASRVSLDHALQLIAAIDGASETKPCAS